MWNFLTLWSYAKSLLTDAWQGVSLIPCTSQEEPQCAVMVLDDGNTAQEVWPNIFTRPKKPKVNGPELPDDVAKKKSTAKYGKIKHVMPGGRLQSSDSDASYIVDEIHYRDSDDEQFLEPPKKKKASSSPTKATPPGPVESPKEMPGGSEAAKCAGPPDAAESPSGSDSSSSSSSSSSSGSSEAPAPPVKLAGSGKKKQDTPSFPIFFTLIILVSGIFCQVSPPQDIQKFPLDIGGHIHELRWDRNQRTFGAHCARPEHKTNALCKMDRGAAKGPLGHMLAWLAEGCCAACCERTDHVQLKQDAVQLTYEKRCQWREWAKTHIPEDAPIHCSHPSFYNILLASFYAHLCRQRR